MPALSKDEVQSRLKDFPGWSLKNDKLHWEHKFKDFKEAFSFMTKVSVVAEEMNHHPEWFNVYNSVVVDLTTHDAGGISDKDFELAKKINSFAS